MLTPRSQRQAAENRLRGAAPVVALAFPVVLFCVASLAVGSCPDTGCEDTGEFSVVLLLLAAPTSLLTVRLMSFAPALAFGLASSLPLWGFLGGWLARRTLRRPGGAGNPWGSWWWSYATACAIWVVAGLVLLALL